MSEATGLIRVINQYESQIKKALPKNTIDPDRIARMFITQVRKNPRLSACDPISVMGSIVYIAQLGIEPERAYLVPFKADCNVIVDYRGLCDLVRRHPDVRDVYAHAVYSNDEFHIEAGSSPKVIHNIANPFDRGTVLGYYACGIMADGSVRIAEPMSVRQIEEHREKHVKKDKYGRFSEAWESSFDEMAKKTLLRKICKTMPQSSEVAQAQVLETLVADGEPQGNHRLIAPEHVPEYNKTADATTIREINAEAKAEETAKVANELLDSVNQQISDLRECAGMSDAQIEETIGCKLTDLPDLENKQLAAIFQRLNK